MAGGNGNFLNFLKTAWNSSSGGYWNGYSGFLFSNHDAALAAGIRYNNYHASWQYTEWKSAEATLAYYDLQKALRNPNYALAIAALDPGPGNPLKQMWNDLNQALDFSQIPKGFRNLGNNFYLFKQIHDYLDNRGGGFHMSYSGNNIRRYTPARKGQVDSNDITLEVGGFMGANTRIDAINLATGIANDKILQDFLKSQQDTVPGWTEVVPNQFMPSNFIINGRDTIGIERRFENFSLPMNDSNTKYIKRGN